MSVTWKAYTLGAVEGRIEDAGDLPLRMPLTADELLAVSREPRPQPTAKIEVVCPDGRAVSGVGYYYTGGARGALPWFSTMANGYYVLMDYDGRPKPTMMAYSALEQQLDGARPAGTSTRGDLTAHLFQKGRGTVAVVWSDRARPLSIKGASVFDLMGNAEPTPVLRPGEPVYLHAPRLSPEELGRALP